MYKKTYKEQEIYCLAKTWAEYLKLAKIHLFVAKMGVGKTSIISAILRSINPNLIVNSPTYGICKVYKLSQYINCAHVDVYRLLVDNIDPVSYIMETIDLYNLVFIESSEDLNIEDNCLRWTIDFISEDTRSLEIKH